MAQTIQLPNYAVTNIKREGTKLNADASAVATTITVQNTTDFFVDDFIIVGVLGAEITELAVVKTLTSDTALELDAGLNFAHNRYEPITVINGDKIKVYRAANVDGTQPADGSFEVIGSPLAIQTDQSFTSYTDSDGSSAYWYKYTFYNSVTETETDIAASKAVRGGNNNYVSIDSIRREAGFANNRNITDTMIDEKRQIAQSEVDGGLSGIYVVPFTAPINPTIENVTLQLATGYLLMSQFTNGSSRYTDGETRVETAQATIERIKSGQLTLTGVTGVVLPESNTTTNGASGWPNATTADLSPSENGAGDFMFKRSSIDGFGTRKY